MGWELDLWGHVRRLVESSRASMQATIEAYRDTMVILYGEIAYQYIQVRTLQNRIELTRQSIRLQEETLQMTSDRNKAGLSPDLDLYQAKMNLAQSRAAIPPLRIALAKATHRLAVLVGDEPASLRELMQVINLKFRCRRRKLRWRCLPMSCVSVRTCVPLNGVWRRRPRLSA
jgi:outer membrane protein TolC